MFNFKLELYKYLNGEKNLKAEPENSSTFFILTCSALPSGEVTGMTPWSKPNLYKPFRHSVFKTLAWTISYSSQML